MAYSYETLVEGTSRRRTSAATTEEEDEQISLCSFANDVLCRLHLVDGEDQAERERGSSDASGERWVGATGTGLSPVEERQKTMKSLRNKMGKGARRSYYSHRQSLVAVRRLRVVTVFMGTQPPRCVIAY